MAESIRKEDWERYRALGSVPPGIREIVLGSWARSRESREMDSLTRTPLVAQDELFFIREGNARLRSAARTTMRRAGGMIGDSGAILLLCEPGCVVMEAAGDARILSRAEENHLHPGGRWEKSAIGTKAIGTTLHT